MLSFFLKLTYFYSFCSHSDIYFKGYVRATTLKESKGEKKVKNSVLAHFSILQSDMAKYLRRDFWDMLGHELASYIASRT